jgi:hypothetical protein
MPITIYPPITQTITGSVSVTNLPLSGSGDLLADVSIAGVDIGPAPMETSLPVTLALDQEVPIRATGPQPMAQSVAVTLASDQLALPIAFPATALAPNAAKEAGGNLDAHTASLAYLAQIADMMRLMLAELRAHNLQLASLTGINVDPAIGDEQATFN